MTTRRKGYSTKQVLDELLGDSDSDVDFTSSNTDSEDAVSDDARSESDTDLYRYSSYYSTTVERLCRLCGRQICVCRVVIQCSSI